LNRFIFFFICLILFLLPLPLGSYRPWAILAIGILTSFTFITHLSHSVFNDKQSLFPPRYSWPLFFTLSVVILVCGIQLFNVSVDVFQTKQMLLKTSFLLMLSWLVFNYCNSAERIKKLIYAVICAGVFQALYASYLNLSPDIVSPLFGYKHTDRAIGTFTYSNFLANYLALCLCFGSGWGVRGWAEAGKPPGS